MPIEIKGQQLRVRVRKPIKGWKYRVVDVGRPGHLQFVMMFPPGPRRKGAGVIQSIRLNLKDYKSFKSVIEAIENYFPQKYILKAKRLAYDWWKRNRGEPETIYA